MSEILFLSHRIPYPPDKGDKIRSYHMLRALAEQHTVHLGTFVDHPADWQHAEAVQKLCGGETCLRPLNPRIARIRSATALLTGDPLTLAYYRDARLSAWIRKLAARRPLAGIFAFSSAMGPYALSLPLRPGAARVMDFCDVDSDKWQQYAASHAQPMKMVYAREARRLAAIESRYVRQFDASLVISDAEETILREIVGLDAGRIQVVPNGVDTEYFDPAQPFENPFPSGVRPIVFTGAMDYHANIDGVAWFAKDVLPAIRCEVPEAAFVIAGSNPTTEVRALANEPGVTVTGRVPDVRPYLAHAAVVVAPLRLARGVQNKVLEALAMARPVVATPNAVQGIPAASEAGIGIDVDATAMADSVVQILRAPVDASRGRTFVQERYGWNSQLEHVCRYFSPDAVAGGVRMPHQSAAA